MSFCLRVAGDFACFTRPEMKAERVSYDVMTPSAARGVFEAVFWKPDMRWIVDRIEVLKPVKWINLRRNEVGKRAPKPSAELIRAGGEAELGMFVEKERQQRAGLFLRDVAYRLRARIADPRGGLLGEDSYNKSAGMFLRRARAGQCFHAPYLGCREFAADVSLVEDLARAKREEPPIAESRVLGYMLYDLDFANGRNPMFFHAEMENGAIRVPPPGDSAIRG